ncbi:hypothetical protein C0J52_08122 [Blattella germanica]|nr:hypothetical protein C0J52_08122 [Blattella germanica]
MQYYMHDIYIDSQIFGLDKCRSVNTLLTVVSEKLLCRSVTMNTPKGCDLRSLKTII